MVGDERGEVCGQFHVQREGIARGLQLEFPTAECEFVDQDIDSVFPLAGPLYDSGDERGAVPSHGAYGGVGTRFAFAEDGAQVGVVEIGKIFRIEFAARRVVAGKSPAEPAGFGYAAATPDGGLYSSGFTQQRIDIFELLESFPAAITLAQLLDRRGEPDRKRFGEVFIGMGLGVPVGQVADKTAAVGTRRIGFGGVVGVGTAENVPPVPALRELIGVINRMSALVTEEHHAPFGGSAFHFHHLPQLQRLQAGMGEVEGDGDGGDTRGGEPFVANVANGTKRDAARGEFHVELLNAGFEFAALNTETKVAEAEGEELIVFESHPWRGRWQRMGRALGH
jgi:hypothetical protein